MNFLMFSKSKTLTFTKEAQGSYRIMGKRGKHED